MDKIIPFPGIRRSGNEPDVIADRFPKPPQASDIEKELQLRMVRGELAHAVRKLLVVAEANDELEWAMHLIAKHLADARREYNIKEDGNAD